MAFRIAVSDARRSPSGPIIVHYNDYAAGGKVGVAASVEVDMVVGADGANSRVAKEIGAGEYDYAIAFQERIRIPDAAMEYYKDLAEMYVGDDVSPDFYGWVFPKCALAERVAVPVLPKIVGIFAAAAHLPAGASLILPVKLMRRILLY